MLSEFDENSEIRFEGHPDEDRMIHVGQQLGTDAAELVRRVRVLKWLALMRSAEQSPALRELLLAAEEQLRCAETHFFHLKEAIDGDLVVAGQMRELCRQVREQRRRWRCLQQAWRRREAVSEASNAPAAVTTAGVLQELNNNDAERGQGTDLVDSKQAQQQPSRRRSLVTAPAQGASSVPRLAPIDETALQRVPAYIRGRVTLERLQRAIEDIEIILRSKYTLLRRPRHELTSSQLDQRCRYEDMETEETSGQYFFSEVDIKSVASLKQDATGKALVNVLRHLGRIRESRAATHCRIWIVPNSSSLGT
jgi:hypothetical protein